MRNAGRVLTLSSLLLVAACSSDSDKTADFSVTDSGSEIEMNPLQTDMLQQVQPQSIGDPAMPDVAGLNGRLLPSIFTTQTGIDPAFAQSSAALVLQLNDSLLLPGDISVTFADCGTANAFYRPASLDGSLPEIRMCHELTALFANFFANNEQAFLASTFVLMHELGHALTDVLQLPVLGIEESYVDGIAAVLLGESGLAEGSVLAGWFFGSQSNTPFFDSHRAGPQRLGDLACWGIGADLSLQSEPIVGAIAAQLIQGGRDCVAEYNQQLLGLNAVLGGNIRGGLNVLSLPAANNTVN